MSYLDSLQASIAKEIAMIQARREKRAQAKEQVKRPTLPTIEIDYDYMNSLQRTVAIDRDTLALERWLAEAGDFTRRTPLSDFTLWSGNVFSEYKAYMGGFKANVKELQGYIREAPTKEYKNKIQDIIDLYVAKKIKNYRTAENAVTYLSNRRSIKSGKADKVYNEVVGKYKEAEPMTGRLTRERLAWQTKKEAKASAKAMKTYSATMILFKQHDAGDKNEEVTVNVETHSKAAKEALIKKFKDENKEKYDKTTKTRQRKHGDLRQFYIGTFDLKLDPIEYAWLNDNVDRMIRRERDNGDFKKAWMLLSSQSVVFSDLMDSTGKTYLAAMYLTNLTDSDTKGDVFVPKKSEDERHYQVSGL